MSGEISSDIVYRPIPLIAIAGHCYDATLNGCEVCGISKCLLAKINFPGCTKKPHGRRRCVSVYGKPACILLMQETSYRVFPTCAECSVLQMPGLRVLDCIVFVHSARILTPGTDIQ
jgi:hypothetical protein